MKKIILLTFVAIAMMACKSPEQKMAEACLREHLKCPSTLRVVAFTMEDREAKLDCDTMFHVARINGKKYSADDYYYNVKSVTIDSLFLLSQDPIPRVKCALSNTTLRT